MSANQLYGNSRKTVQILQRQGIRRSELEALAESCALELVPAIDIETFCLPNPSPPFRTPDFLLIDLCSEPDQIAAVLERVSQYPNEYGTELLVWVSADQIDLVDSQLPERGRHILCDAPDVEAVPILTGALTRMKMQGLRQDDIQTDYRSLHRISDELADFARTLARIAEQDEPLPHALNDRPVSFRPAPSAIFEPLAAIAVAEPATVDPSARAIRNMLKLRRRRESYFDKNLFADPAWDILLDLFAAQIEGKKVSVSSLCIAASVPPTTGLRWISAMTEDGLLLREHDPEDARRVFIRLSSMAEDSLRSYFNDIGFSEKTPI